MRLHSFWSKKKQKICFDERVALMKRGNHEALTKSVCFFYYIYFNMVPNLGGYGTRDKIVFFSIYHQAIYVILRSSGSSLFFLADATGLH